jgi:hypothetical protein
MIDVNTTSKHPTHFLKAVELIVEARSDYNVASENWPHPSIYKFGIPNDNYYAEIWMDGMDWQPSYWVIEEIGYHEPKVKPFIIFNHHEERGRFNDYDFENLIMASLYYRRDDLWAKQNDLGCYTDSVWPYINLFKNELRYKETKLYSFQHASQERVVFWLNELFVPEVYRGKKENRNNRNKEEGQPISLQIS